MKPFILAATAFATFSGCVSSEQGGLIGAGGGYVIAKELGASDEVAILTAIGGLVAGQNLGNSCNTRRSGNVVETTSTINGRVYTGRQETQGTQYSCNDIGGAPGARSPVFSFAAAGNDASKIAMYSSIFQTMINNQFDMVQALAEQSEMTETDYINALASKITVFEHGFNPNNQRTLDYK